MAGQFMWFDLGATDAGQAREFYRALFGWAVAPAADAAPIRPGSPTTSSRGQASCMLTRRAEAGCPT